MLTLCPSSVFSFSDSHSSVCLFFGVCVVIFLFVFPVLVFLPRIAVRILGLLIRVQQEHHTVCDLARSVQLFTKMCAVLLSVL